MKIIRDSFGDVLVFIVGATLLATLTVGIVIGTKVTSAGFEKEIAIVEGKLLAAQCRVAELEGAAEARQGVPVIVDEREGIASWYGQVEHGRTTANGERFDMNAMTAAHPTAAFGSVFVVVRVNDRLPAYHGREIDLSYAAAKRLGIIKQGLARVRVYELTLKPKPSEGD